MGNVLNTHGVLAHRGHGDPIDIKARHLLNILSETPECLPPHIESKHTDEYTNVICRHFVDSVFAPERLARIRRLLAPTGLHTAKQAHVHAKQVIIKTLAILSEYEDANHVKFASLSFLLQWVNTVFAT